MKKHMLKCIALMLVIVLCLPLSVPAFAYEAYEPVETVFTYIDAEGKTCHINISIDANNNTVITSYEDVEYIFDLNSETMTTVVLDDIKNTEPLELHIQRYLTPASNSVSSSKIELGLLQFNPVYDSDLGRNVYNSLKICSTDRGTVTEDYTIHGEEAESLTKIIGAFASFLIGTGMLAEVATTIVDKIIGELVDVGIIEVTGEIVKKAFLETVEARSTHYTLEASDLSSSRTRTYEGSRHVVISDGAHFNETYYSGYYPQFLEREDVAVAMWLYTDFFPYNFPGVRSYG